jgi:hypothetical protein
MEDGSKEKKRIKADTTTHLKPSTLDYGPTTKNKEKEDLFFREGSLSVIGNKIVGKDSGD